MPPRLVALILAASAATAAPPAVPSAVPPAASALGPQPAPAPIIAVPSSSLAATPSYLRFAPEVARFSVLDAAEEEATDKILFVGSSSIRLWDVRQSFPALHAINRGFGGATTPDVLHYYPEVLAKRQPASVVVYVGDNDIADGREPDAVAGDVLALLAKIRADLPQARIVYLSIKPSPLRWSLWPKMAAVNAAVKAKAGAASFDYLDVARALFTPEGTPDPAYYGPDHLHMNPRGYALWTAIVDAYLEPAPAVKTVVATDRR